MSSGGPPPPGHFHSIPHSIQRVKGGTDVQDGELIRVLVDFTVIIVNNVSHLLPTAINDPIVAVEGKLIAMGTNKSS